MLDRDKYIFKSTIIWRCDTVYNGISLPLLQVLPLSQGSKSVWSKQPEHIQPATYMHESGCSVVGIPTAYRLDDWQARIPRVTNFRFLHIIQTNSGVLPTTFPMGTNSSFPGGKRQQGTATDRSPQIHAEVEKHGPKHPCPQHANCGTVLD
jgi:hypothetical protein